MARSINNTAQKMVVTILEVDRANKVITGVLRDGGKIQISVYDAPQAFRWPDIDELWVVERDGVDWQLGNRIRLQQEQSIEDLPFGDLRLDSSLITDRDGNKLIGLANDPLEGMSIQFHNGSWIAASSVSYDTAPIGSVTAFTGTTVPNEWVLAAGQSITEANYPQLVAFAAAEVVAGNTTWAISGVAPNRSATVPNMRDRFVYGGGAGATYAMGTKAGVENVTLTSAQSGIPAHNHTTSVGNQSANHTHGPGQGSSYLMWDNATIATPGAGAFSATPIFSSAVTAQEAQSHTHSVTINNNSAANAVSSHTNMPPHIVLAWIVKAKGVTVDSGVLTGPPGPQGTIGLTGSTGATGPAGPNGPAGLTWQGSWSAGTAYVLNDAVSYSGSSYRRLIPGTTATTPDIDTTNWAVIAQGLNGATAGGDLTGTYPSPTIAAGAVSIAKTGTGVNGLALGVFSAYRSVTQSLATGSAAAIIFDTEERDLSNWHDITTGKYTPQQAGYYQLNAGVGVNQTTASGTRFIFSIWKNGSRHKVLQIGYSVGGDADSFSGSCQVQANGTTDFFTAVLEHNLAGSLATAGGSDRTWFQGEFIGRS